MNDLGQRDFSRDLRFRTSRSSGPGGQNVNKVETKVELIFNFEQSENLSEEEKQLFCNNLGRRVRKDGTIHVTCHEFRSQWKNKEACKQKFLDLLEEGLQEEKERKPKKISKAQKEKRLKEKKIRAEKKARRRGDFD